MAFALPATVTLLFQPKIVGDVSRLFRLDKIFRVGMIAIFYAFATISMYLAYQAGGNISQIGPVGQISTVVTVIAAIFILKEKTNIWQKIFGAVLAVIGALLIF
jgi:uncharacterized membrane protein